LCWPAAEAPLALVHLLRGGGGLSMLVLHKYIIAIDYSLVSVRVRRRKWGVLLQRSIVVLASSKHRTFPEVIQYQYQYSDGKKLL